MRSTLHDPLLTPENRLWRAVLEQAYVDAEGGSDSGDANHEECVDSAERIRARAYLRGDNKQEAAALIMVCGFAELPADRVLSWARKSYPRPRTQPQLASSARPQDSIAIAATLARQTRARSGEHASA